MRSMKNLFFSLMIGAVALFSSPAFAQGQGQGKGDPAKLADIKKLMVLTGAGNIGIQVMSQLIGSLKQAIPASEDFWQGFMKEVNPDELINLVIPVYDKHLSHAEVKELIKFYETPVGKKMISVMPAITQESMQAGQKWGMDLAQRAKSKADKLKSGQK